MISPRRMVVDRYAGSVGLADRHLETSQNYQQVTTKRVGKVRLKAVEAVRKR